jgi:hypothetical protein
MNAGAGSKEYLKFLQAAHRPEIFTQLTFGYQKMFGLPGSTGCRKELRKDEI